MSKKALGRGIEALLGVAEEDKQSSVDFVPISALKPSKYQPRKEFSEEKLSGLAQSIEQKGILQPILVENRGKGLYTIIAGERRYRAAQIAGLNQIPVLVKRLTESEKIEISLIENLQREDLKPLEEAKAYKDLIETAKLSQEEVAVRVGKKRSTIANSLRLFKLPEHMRDALDRGAITPGHARAILSLASPADQEVLYDRILAQDLSVRKAESLSTGKIEELRASKPRPKGKTEKPVASKSAELQSMEQKFIELLGTKVLIKGTESRGKIEIEYFSIDDLDRIWSLITGNK